MNICQAMDAMRDRKVLSIQRPGIAIHRWETGCNWGSFLKHRVTLSLEDLIAEDWTTVTE